MFDGIGKIFTRTGRGLGRLARGKWREGLGDIGEGVAEAAPYAAFVPGIGPLAAVGMNAAGRAAQRGAQEGANLGTVMGAGAKGGVEGAVGQAAGALGGAAAGKLAGSAGGAAAGGAGDPIAGKVTTRVAPSVTGRATGAMAGGAAGGAAGSMAGEAAGDLGKGLGAIGRTSAERSGGEGMASRAGSWLADNPETATDIAGTGLETYGAYKDDQARSRQMRMQEEEQRLGHAGQAARRRGARRALSRRRA